MSFSHTKDNYRNVSVEGLKIEGREIPQVCIADLSVSSLEHQVDGTRSLLIKISAEVKRVRDANPGISLKDIPEVVVSVSRHEGAAVLDSYEMSTQLLESANAQPGGASYSSEKQ